MFEPVGEGFHGFNGDIIFKTNKLIGVKSQLQQRVKSYKDKVGMEKFVVGRDVNMDRVVILSKHVVVGCIEHAKFNCIELIEWVNTNWLLEFGIAP